jgi:hypothetical protein
MPTLFLGTGIRLLNPRRAIDFIVGRALSSSVSVAAARCSPTPLARPLFQMAIVRGLYIGNVKESVSADPEIDKGRLDAGLNVNDAPFVNVPDVTFVTGSFDV